MTGKCNYCGDADQTCHRCAKEIAFHVLQLISLVEPEIVKRDETDQVGINNHLRVVWGLRDALNDYFSGGCKRPATDKGDSS